MRDVVYTARVKIQGVTQMLHHKCGLIETLSKKDYAEEWKSTAYINSENELMVPSLNLKACLKTGAKGIKYGKHFMTKLLPAGVSICFPFEIPIMFKGSRITLDDVKENNWLFTCPVVIGTSRINRTRVAVPIGWEIEFSLEVYNKLIVKETLKEIIENSGYSAGLCDWRPGKGGEFGQFELVSFDIET